MPAVTPRRLFATTLTLLVSLLSGPCRAHFQELIPSAANLTGAQGRTLTLALTFTHPMAQGPVMPMARPQAFGVLIGGDERRDLLASLTPVERQGQSAFDARFEVRRPADLVFYLAPRPYWEPAEGKYIRHYTKVVVDAFSGHRGWDALVGLPVEIEPLVRPYGLWTGNLFRGIVRKAGQPLPFAEVEVTWRNDGSIVPPTDAHRTQLIKADANGTFAYALPRAGWWAFAALTEADRPRPGPDGRPAPVEDGGVIWVNARDMR